jgi:tetratricopeptide (TPR) repeat protein
MAGVAPIGERIQLDLQLNNLRPAVNVDERILFLTKSYLDWNISKWSPLGIGKPKKDPRHHRSEPGTRGEETFALLFNKCFYNAIPLLLTNRTSEAFTEINLACSLAMRCLQLSPYWVFLRLLRLYSYPLWSRFPDVRRQIVSFLQALASRTLPNGHALKPLLEMWVQEEVGADAGRVASLLRLSSDTFGPASGLEAEEWAWIQDEICSLNYQRRELHDALRIARRLAEDPNVPRGVHITSRQMVARYHLQHGNIDEAEPILLQTLRTCAECDTEDEKARFLQQTYSDLGYIWHVRQDRARSLRYYEQALEKAIQVNNGANTNSLRCRIETLTIQDDRSESTSQTDGQQDSSWARWAFCRPYS